MAKFMMTGGLVSGFNFLFVVAEYETESGGTIVTTWLWLGVISGGLSSDC